MSVDLLKAVLRYLLLILPVLFMASGCAAQQAPLATPVNAAVVVSRASVAEVDAQTTIIDQQVRDDYTPRSQACKGDAACLEQAKEETRRRLGDRMALGLAAVAAQNRAADALESAKKCKSEDSDCQPFYLAAAAAAEAEVTLLLVRLRQTAPLPPASPTTAPSAPVPTPAAPTPVPAS